MAKTDLTDEQVVRSASREICGIVLSVCGLMMLLGVLSYDPADIGLFRNDVQSSNWIGPVGAHAAMRLFLYFGVAGYVVPLGLLWTGSRAVVRSYRKILPQMLWLGLVLISLAGLVDMQTFWYDALLALNIGSPGGVIGEVLAQRSLGMWVGHVGAGLVFATVFLFSLIRFFDLHMVDLILQLIQRLRGFEKKEKPEEEEIVIPDPVVEPQKPAKKPRRKKAPKKQKEEQIDLEKLLEEELAGSPKRPAREATPAQKSAPVIEQREPRKKEASKETFVPPAAASNNAGNYQLPPLDLLDPPVPKGKGMSAKEITETAEVLQNALEEFGVEARVTGVQQGPVVTCYEIEPAAGVRVERIKNLSDNLALKMHAESIRIQAPIPGRGVCGVEVPNSNRASVFFRDLVESPDFQGGKQALPLVLGKDVSGDSMVLDLAKMPHLLIAGATGAGKSVCMNSILTGLLMRHSPDDLRMILVDPKTVEFQAYNNLPHLVVPVITNAKKVALGLKWAIDEMERRFKWFSQTGARDLTSFNARSQEEQPELFEEGEEPPVNAIPKKLPYIVIVIDELADLMAVAQAEIEAGIARLAAKSRAAGIHMILATQRPDVKVITGTIKANFPVRIAFKVSQKVDSRTILDRMGADTLLGRGDMLVLPPGSDKLVRSQGAFTSDGEIDRVTSFCKEQGQPEFITEIHEKIQKPVTDFPEADSGEDDEILEQAIEVIRQTKRASTSSLQRRLRIGYTRAARLMDLLEERGVVGPPNGSDPREILIDLDGEIPQNPGAGDDGTAD